MARPSVEAERLVLQGRRQARMQDPEVDRVSDEDRDRILDPPALRHGAKPIADRPAIPLPCDPLARDRELAARMGQAFRQTLALPDRGGFFEGRRAAGEVLRGPRRVELGAAAQGEAEVVEGHAPGDLALGRAPVERPSRRARRPRRARPRFRRGWRARWRGCAGPGRASPRRVLRRSGRAPRRRVGARARGRRRARGSRRRPRRCAGNGRGAPAERTASAGSRSQRSSASARETSDSPLGAKLFLRAEPIAVRPGRVRRERLPEVAAERLEVGHRAVNSGAVEESALPGRPAGGRCSCAALSSSGPWLIPSRRHSISKRLSIAAQRGPTPSMRAPNRDSFFFRRVSAPGSTRRAPPGRGRLRPSRSSKTGRTSAGRRSSVRKALRAPAARARESTAAMSLSFRPGITGATETPVRMPASERRAMVSILWEGRLALGSIARPTASSAKGTLT